MAVVQIASTLRATLLLRSGLQDGIDVLLRQRRPLDIFDLADRLSAAVQPLFAAQATVWAKGSMEAIPLVNELVDRCVSLVAAATEGGKAGTSTARYIFGERWTEEQERQFDQARKDIGEARRKVVARLRAENKGKPLPDLLA